MPLDCKEIQPVNPDKEENHSIFLDGPLPNSQAQQQWEGCASELLAVFRAASSKGVEGLCWASLVAQLVKNLPAMQETWV